KKVVGLKVMGRLFTRVGAGVVLVGVGTLASPNEPEPHPACKRDPSQGDASVPTLLHTTPAPTRTIPLTFPKPPREKPTLNSGLGVDEEWGRFSYRLACMRSCCIFLESMLTAEH